MIITAFTYWFCDLKLLTSTSAMDSTVSPTKFVCWIPNHQWNNIWRWNLWETIRSRWGHKSGAHIRRNATVFTLSLSLCLFLSLSFSVSLTAMWGHSRKTSIYDPGMELSPESNHAAILIRTASLKKQWENKFLFLKSPILWYFVLAAWADKYSFPAKH